MKNSSVCALFAVLAASASALIAADNVILFIGDGMGPDHVKAGRILVNGSSATPLSFESLGVKANAISVLPNGTITDSATAGTALATGYQHPANGTISMGSGYSIKASILELAKAKGFRTGIITTDDIGGATPGAFGAHEPDRNRMTEIRNDYFWRDTLYSHDPSLPNLLLGGGPSDPSNLYVIDATTLGYTFAPTANDLSRIFAGNVLGLFGSTWAPMTGMAYRSGGSTEPLLSEMVHKALTLLENEEGLFLMAESANIDKMSHSNDKNFVWEVPELDAAVRAAVAWKASRPGDNTLILVTADHETGGLSVPEQTLSPGTVPPTTWSSTGHTARNVPVYATWPNSLDALTIDNTEVFFLLEDYLNLSTGAKPPVIAGLTALGVTETSATVQWDTVEPSSTALYSGADLITQDTSRVTRHTVVLGDLTPGTPYELTAVSKDIAGYSAWAEVSFFTKVVDVNALVLVEPAVSSGVVSGTIAGLSAYDDDIVQTVTEAASGGGSRLSVQYTLHTSAAPASIDALTLRGAIAWSSQDGAADSLITEVRVPLPGGSYGWERITLPFPAFPPCNYVDGNGDVVVRFTDSASFRRERKDILSVDYLLGEVVLGSTAPTPPTQPATLAASTVTDTTAILTWGDSSHETKYLIWRHTADAGWAAVAEVAADTVTFTDTGLAPGTTYTYVVRALNGDGYADSDPASATTAAILLPPQGLKASVTKGVLEVNLTWTDTNTIETGYEILRGTTPDGNFTSLAVLDADVVAYTDRPVTRGTKYYYQVRALKGAETGPSSATVSATAR